jgi:response regulator RpfG family c-di-GMP phosphodiesterase
MPSINGFESYQRIKEMDNKPKVCLTTAFEEYQNEFNKSFPFLHVDCFTKKPVELRNLIKIIRSRLYNS